MFSSKVGWLDDTLKSFEALHACLRLLHIHMYVAYIHVYMLMHACYKHIIYYACACYHHCNFNTSYDAHGTAIKHIAYSIAPLFVGELWIALHNNLVVNLREQK